MSKAKPICPRGLVTYGRRHAADVVKKVRELEKQLNAKVSAENCPQCGGFHIRVVTDGN